MVKRWTATPIKGIRQDRPTVIMVRPICVLATFRNGKNRTGKWDRVLACYKVSRRLK